MIALPRLLPRLRSDELVGLVIAIAAHLALIVALTVHALRTPAIIPPPPRVTVSLAEDVGLVSEGQQVAQEAQAAVAPTLAENPEPAPQPAPLPEPKPEPKPKPKAEPKPQPKAQPKPSPKPTPKPVAKPIEKPKPKPETPRVATPAPPRATTAPPAKRQLTLPTPATKAGGGTRLGEDFLKGQGASEAEALVPASQIGASARASLIQAVARQLKPNWRSPSGVDVDKLRTTIEWELNPNGTLKGAPKFVSQDGQTDANRPQQGPHREAAIRAIRQAAPFDLPDQYYNGWKKLRFTFDWTLN